MSMFKNNQSIAEDGRQIFCIFLPERPEESRNLIAPPRVLVKLKRLLPECYIWRFTKGKGWDAF